MNSITAIFTAIGKGFDTFLDIFRRKNAPDILKSKQAQDVNKQSAEIIKEIDNEDIDSIRKRGSS